MFGVGLPELGVLVLVLLLIGVLIALWLRRQRTERRVHAAELRADASGLAGGLAESQRKADEAIAQANLAKAQAERAEEAARAATQSHQVEQARYEDQVREADRIDPDVDIHDDGYEPDIWNDTATDPPEPGTDAGSSGARATGYPTDPAAPTDPTSPPSPPSEPTA